MAISIVKYKELMDDDNSDAFTSSDLRRSITQHIQKHHRSLLMDFERELRQPAECLPFLRTFNWSGPSFTIGDGPVEGDDVDEEIPSMSML